MAFMANQRGYVPLERASSLSWARDSGARMATRKRSLTLPRPARRIDASLFLWRGGQRRVPALHTGKTPHGTVKFARNSASRSLHCDPFGCGAFVHVLTCRRAAEKDKVRAEDRNPARSRRCLSQQHSRRRLHESAKICRSPEIFRESASRRSEIRHRAPEPRHFPAQSAKA